MIRYTMPGWRNLGSRSGIKIRYPQGCTGSSPVPGTNKGSID